MSVQKEFTPRDFFELARDAAEHEAELKIRLARAGVRDQADRQADRDNERR